MHLIIWSSIVLQVKMTSKEILGVLGVGLESFTLPKLLVITFVCSFLWYNWECDTRISSGFPMVRWRIEYVTVEKVILKGTGCTRYPFLLLIELEMQSILAMRRPQLRQSIRRVGCTRATLFTSTLMVIYTLWTVWRSSSSIKPIRYGGTTRNHVPIDAFKSD